MTKLTPPHFFTRGAYQRQDHVILILDSAASAKHIVLTLSINLLPGDRQR